VRFAARTIVFACLAAAVLVPAAAAADRMWVGFQDDPMFRWDPQRTEAMDRARGNEARIVRTVVDWSRVAPDKPASPADSFDPAYNFQDIDELVQNAQQRGMEVLITLWGTPKWANGGQAPQVAPRNMTDFQNFARAVASRYSGRFAGYPYVRFFSIWNESNLGTFLRPQFNRAGNTLNQNNTVDPKAQKDASGILDQITKLKRDEAIKEWANEALRAFRGSLPALRTGTTPVPVAYATAAATTKPRASTPATTSNPSG